MQLYRQPSDFIVYNPYNNNGLYNHNCNSNDGNNIGNYHCYHNGNNNYIYSGSRLLVYYI